MCQHPFSVNKNVFSKSYRRTNLSPCQFGQTPLHYAFIYSAPMEILNILGNPGSQQNMKDVVSLCDNENVDFLIC